jgi:hypothetical protein
MGYSHLTINSIIQKDCDRAGGEIQMKFKIASFTLLVSLVLTACGGDSSNQGNASEEVNTQDIKELVQDYSIGNIKDHSASITSKELIVTDSDESEQTYDLPKDEFFVSIAPYENETHP